MQFRHPRRRLLAATVALLACAASAAPSHAIASGGTYTQILCSNPDTGNGVGTLGQYPDGFTRTRASYAHMAGQTDWQRCAGRIGGTDGIVMSLAGSWGAASNDGISLAYRTPSDVTFDSATVYRSIALPIAEGGNWTAAIQRADSDWHYGMPRYDLCGQYGGGGWGTGCLSAGIAASPWAPANRVEIGGGDGGLDGFNAAIKCDWPSCQAGPGHTMRIFGGKASLRDASNPVGGAVTGSLTEDTLLRGVEELAVSATDTGSGVYRLRLLLDDEPRLSEIVDANAGRCADVNPGNGDAYEFAHGRPCKLSAGRTLSFDTASLPEGEANLKLVVEDAAGNATTLLSRRVTVDNIAAPSIATSPAVTGTLRRTHRLTAQDSVWNDHGASGDPVIAYQWQRCDRQRANCQDIAGARDEDYTLSDDDVGRTVRVVETAKNSEGETQAASEVTAIVTREDGTLPQDRDGIDNDSDGTVDEPGERTPDPAPTGPDGPDETEQESGAVNTRPPSGPNGPSVHQTSSSSGAPTGRINGEGASRRARLTVAFAGSSARRLARKYGKNVVVTGSLVDEHGRPIRGAVVEVSSVAAVRGAAAVNGKALVTGPDGGFRYTASAKTASRQLRFAYRYENPGEVVAADSLELHVKAAVKLGVKIKGSIVRYSGRVLSQPMPRAGKVVILQGRVKGASWQTFASRRARGKGAFKGTYRLKVRRPGTRLQFRARVLTEAGYPYLSVSGRTVTRVVR